MAYEQVIEAIRNTVVDYNNITGGVRFVADANLATELAAFLEVPEDTIELSIVGGGQTLYRLNQKAAFRLVSKMREQGAEVLDPEDRELLADGETIPGRLGLNGWER